MQIAVFLLVSISGIGTAAEIIVQPGNSIQAAVDNASSGDTIIIKPGTYTENINITKGNLTIRSESETPKIQQLNPEARQPACSQYRQIMLKLAGSGLLGQAGPAIQEFICTSAINV